MFSLFYTLLETRFAKNRISLRLSTENRLPSPSEFFMIRIGFREGRDGRVHYRLVMRRCKLVASQIQRLWSLYSFDYWNSIQVQQL